MIGLISLCPAILAACSNTNPEVKIETVYIKPPTALLREITAPVPELRTNLDLLTYALDLRGIVDELNLDKRLLAEFYENGE